MREFIFCFSQQQAINLNLNLSELLFLDYFYNFSISGAMRYIYFNGKRYYKLTYGKILSDLPILKKQERQLREMITNLEQKKIAERYRGKKNQMYIFVNFELLFGNIFPSDDLSSAEIYRDAGGNLLTIDNYNKIKNINDIMSGDEKKIKLKNMSGLLQYDCEGENLTNYTTVSHFEKLFKKNAIMICGNTIGEMYFGDSKITTLSDDSIVFFFKMKESIVSNLNYQFRLIVQETIKNVKG